MGRMSRGSATACVLAFVVCCRILLALPETLAAFNDGATSLLQVQLVISLIAAPSSVLTGVAIVAIGFLAIGLLTGDRSVRVLWPCALWLFALDLVGLSGADLAGTLMTQGSIGLGVAGIDAVSAVLNWILVTVFAGAIVWLVWFVVGRMIRPAPEAAG